MVMVRLDNVLEQRIGSDYGLSMSEVLALGAARPPKVVSGRKRCGERPAFTCSTEQTREQLDEVIAACARFREGLPRGLSDVVVLGIGGSALGTVALEAALCHPYTDLLPPEKRPYPRLHVLDNIDPAQTMGLLDVLDPETTAFIAISKSGDTAETIACFAIVRQWLRQAGCEWQRHSIIITDEPDPATGRKTFLRKFAEREGVCVFDIPILLGGRYSVLSPVGAVPATLAGVDVHEMVRGAADMYARCEKEDYEENPAFLLAATCYLYAVREAHPRNICVLMPYSSVLSRLADWFVQLWAESLGKARDRDGRLIHVGQTPVKAVGATDQHSMLQLLQEGPHDKLVMFLEAADYGREAPIPLAQPGEPEYLGGKSLNELFSAEKRGTEYALTAAQRPNLTILVDRVTPYSVGELFFLFWMQTAIAAEWLNVDAFDQPGVVASKTAIRALMGAPGAEYDEIRSKMAGWA